MFVLSQYFRRTQHDRADNEPFEKAEHYIHHTRLKLIVTGNTNPIIDMSYIIMCNSAYIQGTIVCMYTYITLLLSEVL